MKTLHTHVTPTSKIMLPTEQLVVGDVLHITMMEPTPALRQQLEVDAIQQNKTFAIVGSSAHKLVVCCLRTARQVWHAALLRSKRSQLLNAGRSTYGLEFMKPGQTLEVVSLSQHPYYGHKPVNMPALRVYASQTAKRLRGEYSVTKTPYGAEVHRKI